MRHGRWLWALALAALFSPVAFSQERIELCAACHGQDGNSMNPRVPSIAGQPKLFLENQLILFREELRRSGEMAAVVKGIKDAEIVKLAAHFSALPSRAMESGSPRLELLGEGKALAQKLRCGICHLADFSGQKQVPRLAGQREAYLEVEMRAYRDNRRRGGDTIMAAALYGVSDADIRALAHYLARSGGPALPGR